MIDFAEAFDVVMVEVRKSARLPRKSDPAWVKVLEGRVRVLMSAVRIPWTAQAGLSAASVFIGAYVDAERQHNRTAKTVTAEVEPIKLPVYTEITIPAGVKIHDYDPAEPFDRRHREPFSGFEQSMFPVACFEAGDTEYALAALLERAASVTWWKRLDQTEDADAKIAVTRVNDYLPDFVVYEEVGETYYIVEGKRSDQKQEPDVVAKANATRDVLAYVPGIDVFEGQSWKYLLVDEKDIAGTGNWEGLKGLATN